ncbi:uncharacterized protein FFB20_15902 [Fusarium fujikuroi]|nr:uncharacterized protein FFB20_15902 [Fusarium fujikuroi]
MASNSKLALRYKKYNKLL